MNFFFFFITNQITCSKFIPALTTDSTACVHITWQVLTLLHDTRKDACCYVHTTPLIQMVSHRRGRWLYTTVCPKDNATVEANTDDIVHSSHTHCYIRYMSVCDVYSQIHYDFPSVFILQENTQYMCVCTLVLKLQTMQYILQDYLISRWWIRKKFLSYTRLKYSTVILVCYLPI